MGRVCGLVSALKLLFIQQNVHTTGIDLMWMGVENIMVKVICFAWSGTIDFLQRLMESIAFFLRRLLPFSRPLLDASRQRPFP